MNVATFVLFRILLLAWMTRWMTIHRDDVPILFFTVGSLGLATIVGMNIVLFYRILVGDYLSSPKSKITALDEGIHDETENEAVDCKTNGKSETLHSSIHRRQPHQIVQSLFDKQD